MAKSNTLGDFRPFGFPLAALGAGAEIMQHFDKALVGADRWLMQLGTLSGNPVAAAARHLHVARKTVSIAGSDRS